jgi:hypothetical protein
MIFNDKELAELKSKLAVIAARPPHWNETCIKGWNGMMREAERMDAVPEWWKNSRQNNLAAVNELLEKVGLSKLRDGVEEENVHAGERGVTASEVAEHQRDKEKNMGRDDLDPEENESIAAWLARLNIHVDASDPFFMALRSHAGRFRGDAPARKTLDAKLVQAFLDKFRKVGKR